MMRFHFGLIGGLMLGCLTPAMATTIWVEQEGLHSALIVPTTPFIQAAPELAGVVGHRPFVRFGWGDRDYYGASRHNAVMALKALLHSPGSVIEVAGFDTPAAAGQHIVATSVDNWQWQALVTFITTTFHPDQQGKAQWVRSEPTGFDYYKAQGRYSLLRNCNTWTAEGLHLAGLPVQHRWVFLPGPLLKALKAKSL